MSSAGASRRHFLQSSAMTLGAALLPRSPIAHAARSTQTTSVVWLWLGGGPAHIETFDPKMSAPSDYRSTVGAVQTVIPGIHLGGLFPKMARIADHMAFVRSFGHEETCHEAASHRIMTGTTTSPASNSPSLGALLAHHRGPLTVDGLPNYVRLGGIQGDGPGLFGPNCQPHDAMSMVDLNSESTGFAAKPSGWHALRYSEGRGLPPQANHALRSTSGRATQTMPLRRFGRKAESTRTRDRYGRGLGEQVLTARRLCEAGVGFVTIHCPGWDMHGQLVEGFRQLAPQVDRAVAAFVEDTVDHGSDRRILLVITGEFGRTPRLNAHGGRDHWPTLTPLALAGGGLKMGQVIGASTQRGEMSMTTPLGPRNLKATVLHVLGIPCEDPPIAELV